MTLNEIMKALYFKREAYFIDMFGKVKHSQTTLYSDRNNCVSEKHIDRWLYINDLLNVSIYLNEGWTPDWENSNQLKYIICFKDNKFVVTETAFPISFTYFKSKDLAEKAIHTIGEKALLYIYKG